jgi:DNA processing protein
MNITKEQLIAYAIQHDGEYHAIKKAINANAKYQETKDVMAITIVDKEYPKELLELLQPPFVLFYKGNKHLLAKSKVAIVGSRNPSDYAIDMTKRLVSALPKDHVVVSGLAKGIDGVAHQSSFEAHQTIGVLGCGIDRVYPYQNKEYFKWMSKHHLIISEYPLNATPYPHRFIARNRIIAALSNPLYVMAAAKRSGTLISVDYALSLNKDVVVLPHPLGCISGEGCNHLIASGALMLTNLEDLFIIKKEVNPT